jgi:hypothetical protein
MVFSAIFYGLIPWLMKLPIQKIISIMKKESVLTYLERNPLRNYSIKTT